MVGGAKRNSRLKRIAYIDLFAGPGRYKDGSASTPLQVLTEAIGDENLRSMLVALFNDADADNSRTLKAEIEKLPGIERLKYPPRILNEEIDGKTAEQFEEISLIPSLVFLDPWGYRGLSLRLFDSVLKNWGCDCIFFFNYNRINMGVSNQKVREHIDDLLGEDRAEVLRPQLEGQPSDVRELLIVDSLCEALQEKGSTRFVLPFRYRHPEKGAPAII